MAEEDKTRAKIKIEVDAKSAEADLKRLQGELDKTDGSTKRLAGTSNVAAASAEKFAGAQTSAGQALGATARQTAAAVMGLGKFGKEAAAATGALTQFAGSAGVLGAALGPIGIALAGITTALPFLVQAFQDSASAGKSFEDSLRDIRREATSGQRALERYLGAVDAVMARERGAARASLIRSGGGSVEEQRANLEVMEARLRTLQAGAETVNDELGFTYEINRQQGRSREQLEEIRELQNGIVQATLNLAEAEASVTREQEERAAEMAAREEERARREREAAARAAQSASAAREREMRAELQRQAQTMGFRYQQAHAGDEEFDPTASRNERQLEAKRQEVELGQKNLEIIQAQQKAQEDADRKAQAAARERIAMLEQERQQRLAIISAVSDSGARMMEGFGAGAAVVEAWKGAMEAAEAWGSYPDPVGMLAHGTSAVMHFANAAKMGGGGGSASLPNVGTGASMPSSFDGGPSGGGGGGGPTTIAVHINDPVDEARAGVIEQRHARAARRAYSGRV